MVQVMPSGHERLMETFCGPGDIPHPHPDEQLPLVFHSNAQSVILTYNWESGGGGGGDDESGMAEGFNASVAFPKRPHRK